MLRFIKYIIHREAKLFLLGVLINILLVVAIKMNWITRVGIILPEYILTLYVFLLALVLTERLSWYIEQGMLFDNREYFMSIPIPITSILNSIVIMACLEIFIWYGIMNFFMKNSIISSMQLFSFLMPLFVALVLFGGFMLSLVSSFSRNRLSSNFILGFTVAFLTIIYILLYNKFGFRVPYMYDWKIGIISLCLFLIGISYYGLCKKNAIGEKRMVFRLITSLFVAAAILTYGLGQNYVYANRQIDEIPQRFVVDNDILGQWNLVGIDYDSSSIAEVNAKKYGDVLFYSDSFSFDAYYIIEFYENGTTNHQLLWTKGFVYDKKLSISQQYELVDTSDTNYLIIEWKNKKYIFNNGKPIYYIYKRALDS